MPPDLRPTLAALSSPVTAVHGESVPGTGETGGLGVTLEFADGTAIHVYHQRLRDAAAVRVTSFDHGGRRGGPPTDALAELRAALFGQSCAGVTLVPVTGDLAIRLDGGLLLEGFRLRQVYEDWEVRLANGDTYWSNMITP